jgi:hypothetical protein
MDGNKVTAIHALCKFDVLLRKCLLRGGVLSMSQKRELDSALNERAKVCASLGLPETQAFG